MSLPAVARIQPRLKRSGIVKIGGAEDSSSTLSGSAAAAMCLGKAGSARETIVAAKLGMARLLTASRSAGTRKQPLRVAGPGVVDDFPRRHEGERFGQPALQKTREKNAPPRTGACVGAPGSQDAYKITRVPKRKKRKSEARERVALRAPGNRSRWPKPAPPCAAAPHPGSRPSPPRSPSASCPSPAGPSGRSGSSGPRTRRSS